MWTTLHWLQGPWPGRLALAARPRGGDWLSDEIAHGRGLDVSSVFSLLTRDEEADLGLAEEAQVTTGLGMRFFSLPIPDRQVPESDSAFGQALDDLATELRAGRNVVLHCRQGIGRTGLMAACLLVAAGLSLDEAIRRVSAARGLPVPETREQLLWMERYAQSFAASHG